MNEFDLDIFLQEFNLNLLDVYLDKENNEIVIDFEELAGYDLFDEDMVIAEMEINFDEVENIMFDYELQQIIATVTENFKLEKNNSE